MDREEILPFIAIIILTVIGLISFFFLREVSVMFGVSILILIIVLFHERSSINKVNHQIKEIESAIVLLHTNNVEEELSRQNVKIAVSEAELAQHNLSTSTLLFLITAISVMAMVYTLNLTAIQTNLMVEQTKIMINQTNLIINPPPKKPNLQLYIAKDEIGSFDHKLYLYNAGEAPCFKLTVVTRDVTELVRVIGDDFRSSERVVNRTLEYDPAMLIWIPQYPSYKGEWESLGWDLTYLHPGDTIPLGLVINPYLTNETNSTIKVYCDGELREISFISKKISEKENGQVI